MKKYKVYIAYGSNMNKGQMKNRCPNAIPLESSRLENYKLEFRGVANVIKCEGAETPVALWLITDDCEKALDRYEGYPYLYRKEYVEIEVKLKGEIKRTKAMLYVMNKGNINEPNDYYYETIKEGYENFNIDKKPLELARKESML